MPLSCPCCFGRDVVAVKSVWREGTEYTMHQCRNDDCRHGFVLPIPAEHYLLSHYSYWQLNSGLLDSRSLEQTHAVYEHLFSDHIKKILSPHAVAALDLGCGIGTLCAVLRNHGLLVEGIDINAESIKHAERLYSIVLRHGDINCLDKYFRGKHFDLICIMNTLNCVAEPKKCVESLFRFLAPGGVVVVSVPNIDSDDYLAAAANWHYLDYIPLFTSYFSASSLNTLFSGVYSRFGMDCAFKNLFMTTFNRPDQKQGESLTAIYQLIRTT